MAIPTVSIFRAEKERKLLDKHRYFFIALYFNFTSQQNKFIKKAKLKAEEIKLRLYAKPD